MVKIEKLVNIDFNTKTTYGDDDDKYIKTKIKTYKDNITANFYNKIGSKKVLKEKIPHKCLSIMILNSVFYTYEKYYPQYFQNNVNMPKKQNYIDELKSDSNNNKQFFFNKIEPNSIW